MEEIKKCVDCGATFIVRRYGMKRCPGCQKKYKAKLIRDWQKRNVDKIKQEPAYIAKHKNTHFIKIIHDPLDILDGGFQDGAEFSYFEMQNMLQMGSFTPGTIIEMNGKKYEIVNNQLRPFLDNS